MTLVDGHVLTSLPCWVRVLALQLRQLAASVGRRLSCCKTGLEPVLPNRGSPEPQLSPADKEAASPRGEPPGLAPLGSGGMDEEGADVEAASANGRTPVAADLRPYSQSSSSSFFKDAKDNPAATSRLSSFQSDPAGRAPAGSEPDTGDESGGGGGSAPAAAKVRRRVRAWLAWTVSCGPEWKGVQGEPLSTYQSRHRWLLLGSSASAAACMHACMHAEARAACCWLPVQLCPAPDAHLALLHPPALPRAALPCCRPRPVAAATPQLPAPGAVCGGGRQAL